MRWITVTSGLFVSVLAFVAIGAFAPADGWAQDVDEITVTARLREESLQEVPISLQAFTDKQLKERNIENVYDIAAFTPNFQMNRNLGRRLDRPIIRGVNPPGRGRANASFFVDGVYLPDGLASISTTSLDNVERVEVLRGPQSALFGRATFAGAINYITRDIRDVWEAEINAKAGSDSEYKLSAWASGPIIEDRLKVYVGAGTEGWDGEWRNDLREGQANASGDINSSLDFFNGPGVWAPNIPDLAAGDLPCPAGVGYIDVLGNREGQPGFRPDLVGCPPQRADNTPLGGESLWNAVIKFEFTPTDNLEFNFKAERSETDDDPFAAEYFNPVFDPVNGVQLAPGLNCAPPVYDVDNEIYIPSPGWYCGELDIDLARSQINFPSFAGVATCPPGNALPNCIQVQRDAEGNPIRDSNNDVIPILDANGNIIPVFQSAPAPFLGQRNTTERFLFDATYTWNEWQFLGRVTAGNYEEENVRDLERNYSLGPVTTGLFEGYSIDLAETDSFEFRATSPGDSRLRGLFGYYYYEQEAQGSQRRFNSFSNGYLFSFSRRRFEKVQAIFGSIEYDLTDQISLSLDARYSEDTIRQGANDEACADGYCVAEQTQYDIVPRFIVNYNPNDEMNFYFSFSEGNKPNDFNQEWFDDNTSIEIIRAATGDAPCDPSIASDPFTASWINENSGGVCGKALVKSERLLNWEIGAKLTLLEGRLISNTALFYMDWTNQAVDAQQCIPRADITAPNPDFDPLLPPGPDNPEEFPNASCEVNLGVNNSAQTRILGLETDMTYLATDNLTLNLAYGYVDSKIEELFDDQLASFSCNWWEFSQSSEPLVTRPLPDCAAQGTGDASGNRNGFTPDHNLSLSAAYIDTFTENVEWFAKTFFNYESKKYVSSANLAEIGEVYNWDASVGLQSDNWILTAYVKNILNEDTPTIAFDFPLFDNSKIPGPSNGLPDLPFFQVTNQAGAVAPQVFILTPRRGTNYGVTLEYRFGG
jgi:outer membrane receptor protein involved in Fe transport